MNILGVDDSRAMRAIIRHAIRQMGMKSFTYLEASNGAEALGILGKSPVDLVICDFNMPEMNGLELLRAMKQGGKAMAFGFITSDATTNLRDEAHKEGARFILTKPFTQASFAETVGPVLAELGSGALVADEAPGAQTAMNDGGPLTVTEIGKVLRSLIRLKVQISESKPVPLPPPGTSVVAEYGLNGTGIAGIAVCDPAFASHVASSLSMIPAGSADDALTTGQITDMMWENLHEILNVMSRLMAAQGGTRVSLRTIHRPGSVLPPELVAAFAQPLSRLDVSVNVETYRNGTLTILVFGKGPAA